MSRVLGNSGVVAAALKAFGKLLRGRRGSRNAPRVSRLNQRYGKLISPT